jgi:hypothetical protein
LVEDIRTRARGVKEFRKRSRGEGETGRRRAECRSWSVTMRNGRFLTATDKANGNFSAGSMWEVPRILWGHLGDTEISVVPPRV